MGYDDRDREHTGLAKAPRASMIEEPLPVSAAHGLSTWIGVGATVLGLIVLIAGVIFGLSVLSEAWGLYQEPERIERVAQAVERGSNIDKALVASVSKSEAATEDSVRVSYLLAWFVAAAMMFVCGALSFWAVTAGGNLALRGLERRKKP